MAKTKKTTKKEDTPKFDLNDALKQVNPLMREGFHKFILNTEVKTLDDFKKYYKIYAGDEL